MRAKQLDAFLLVLLGFHWRIFLHSYVLLFAWMDLNLKFPNIYPFDQAFRHLIWVLWLSATYCATKSQVMFRIFNVWCEHQLQNVWQHWINHKCILLFHPHRQSNMDFQISLVLWRMIQNSGLWPLQPNQDLWKCILLMQINLGTVVLLMHVKVIIFWNTFLKFFIKQ